MNETAGPEPPEQERRADDAQAATEVASLEPPSADDAPPAAQASPTAESEPARISPFAYLPTGPGTILGAAFDLLNRARVELRSASFYIGLVVLGTVGPLALLAVGAEVRYETSPAFFEEGIENFQGYFAYFGIAGILAFGGLVVASVESQAVAAALLGARLDDRPISVRDAVRRSRIVFWRLVGATIVVNGSLGVVQGVLQVALAAAFRSRTELSDVSAALLAGVVGTPFAYVTTGIVLGDVGPIEAARRSIGLFRARKRSALVVSVLALFTQFISLFALAAGGDVLVRTAEMLGLNFTSGIGGLAVISAIVMAAVFAFGTLTFVISSLAMAPQVVMFAALTHVAPGLDRVRPNEDDWDPNAWWQARAGFRWITLPLLGGMALGALSLVGGLATLGS